MTPNQGWGPTRLERVIGVFGALYLCLVFGGISTLFLRHSGDVTLWFWLLPLLMLATSLGLLYRIAIGKPRRLELGVIRMVSVAFLGVGVVFTILSIVGDGGTRTYYFLVVALVAAVIGLSNLVKVLRTDG